jgi:DNA-directed RNA polymerase subunit RPC12/RpoP
MSRDWYGVTGNAGFERRTSPPYQSRFIRHAASVTYFQSLNLLRRCFECGQPVGRKEIFCPRCGAKQPREPKQELIDRINRIYKI